jgi:transketolase
VAVANEVAEAYRVFLALKSQPVALVLSRQNLPTLDRAKYVPASGLHRGSYVLADATDSRLEVILIGAGSEVSLCVAAYEKLSAEGIKTRAVSMPCLQLFDAQPAGYRNAVLPPT